MQLKEPLIVIGLCILLLAGCTQPTTEQEDAQLPETTYTYPEDMPNVLQQCLEKNGGIQAWKTAGGLSYELQRGDGSENHTIDLPSRKVLIEADSFQIGFDGQQVWVAPNKAAFGTSSARFYHNLYFYFFAIPHVLTDPGIRYDDMGFHTVDSISYHKVGIRYGDGVGDSPEDEYHLYIDPSTFDLKFITYTVTYFSGESSDKFNSLVYDGWTQAGGLRFPSTLTSYRWEDGGFGEQRFKTVFTDIQLSAERPEASIFTMPAQAEVDVLPTP